MSPLHGQPTLIVSLEWNALPDFLKYLVFLLLSVIIACMVGKNVLLYCVLFQTSLILIIDLFVVN